MRKCEKPKFQTSAFDPFPILSCRRFITALQIGLKIGQVSIAAIFLNSKLVAHSERLHLGLHDAKEEEDGHGGPRSLFATTYQRVTSMDL